MGRVRLRHTGEGFFPREEAEGTDDPYTPEERDQLLEFVLENGYSDHTFEEWRRMSKRSAYGAKRQWQLFLYSEEKGTHVWKYKPTARKWRGGRLLGFADKKLIKKHRADKVPLERTAIILQRDISEIDPGSKDGMKEKKILAPTLDLLLAIRYAKHVYDVQLISKQDYIDMRDEELEYGGAVLPDDPRDVPGYIKSLALYLTEKHKAGL